ncbi:MAG: S24 family peptidase [Planctomycetota bacterium]
MAATERFRDQLRRRRRERGLTQFELARLAGVTRSYINMVERGKVRPPSAGVVARMERALKLPEGELGALADLSRIPDRFKRFLHEQLPLDDETLRGARQILDIIGTELNAAWTLPDEKRQLAQRLRPFREHASWDVRRLACALLARLSWSGSADDIRAAQDDPHPLVRVEAARAVGELTAENSRELFERSCADPDRTVRLAAVESAHRRPRTEFVEPLLRLAQGDSNGGVREAAVRALGRISASAAKQAITELAGSPDAVVARLAGQLLEREGDLLAPGPADPRRARSIQSLREAIQAAEKSNVVQVDLRVIPVLSHTAAGDPAQFTDGDYPAGFADEYVLAPTDVTDPHAFGLRIRGDSMSPDLRSGDIVIVSPGTTLAEGLKVVAKIRDGEITCKVLASAQEDRVILASANPAYSPMVLPRREVVWIYPVVRSVRNELPL